MAVEKRAGTSGDSVMGDSSPPVVLIVDDEPGFASILAKRLRLRGFDSVLAPDGQTGLVLLRETACLAVLLDLRLPDIPGAEVLRRIRATEPLLPVFIVTAHGTDVDREECMAAGAERFLTKPVDIEEIVRYLDAYREGAK